MPQKEKKSPDLSTARPSNWRVFVLFVIWLAFIFGTSCTVMRPEEFFRLVSKSTGAGRESMERFTVFWGISWFAIVKGWHFIEFTILTVLAVATLKRFYGNTTSSLIILAMLFCVVFAVSDEWHQSFIPDRFGTVKDILIDSLGVCTAGAIMLVRLKQINANNKAMHPNGRF